LNAAFFFALSWQDSRHAKPLLTFLWFKNKIHLTQKINRFINHRGNHMIEQNVYESLIPVDLNATDQPASVSSRSYDDPPSRLEMAVAMFTNTATSESVGSVHPRSVRIPSMENYTIEALAQYSGMSVNKVIIQLLQVALEEVFKSMSEADRAPIEQLRGKLFAEFAFDATEKGRKYEQAGKGEI
jgi:hypothetical protein